jgi:hypothetical protein
MEQSSNSSFSSLIGSTLAFAALFYDFDEVPILDFT